MESLITTRNTVSLEKLLAFGENSVNAEDTPMCAGSGFVHDGPVVVVPVMGLLHVPQRAGHTSPNVTPCLKIELHSGSVGPVAKSMHFAPPPGMNKSEPSWLQQCSFKQLEK